MHASHDTTIPYTRYLLATSKTTDHTPWDVFVFRANFLLNNGMGGVILIGGCVIVIGVCVVEIGACLRGHTQRKRWLLEDLVETFPWTVSLGVSLIACLYYSTLAEKIRLEIRRGG